MRFIDEVVRQEHMALCYQAAHADTVFQCPRCGREIRGNAYFRHRAVCVGKPRIVCLCGSTRFTDAFRTAQLNETLAGRIVLTIGCHWHSDEALGLTDADKARLDELHLRKIDLAGEVLILNVGGYIGDSTRRELAYARAHGKAVRFLEPETQTPNSKLQTPAVSA